MSVPIVILGFLKERDYHGYELKKEIQHHMGDWTDIKFGSIYHALKKLVESGCVEVVGEEHQSGRPDRTIYRITVQGREEFRRLLIEVMGHFQRPYLDFDVGLYFACNLPTKELRALLTDRRKQVKAARRALESNRQLPAHRDLPPVCDMILEHAIRHLDTETKWLKVCIDCLKSHHLYANSDDAESPTSRQ
ncbi:MAG: PadR family transcriptional regulator [Candidatus Zixiibacteriota bacterium]|nr:MAG: PadR family transcriptional regulator [candidate division Zixibacteria bacterium]